MYGKAEKKFFLPKLDQENKSLFPPPLPQDQMDHLFMTAILKKISHIAWKLSFSIIVIYCCVIVDIKIKLLLLF